MPKVSQAHMDARRQQILDAAVVCFAERGIHGSSIQDICRTSGLSAGAIYRHFANKQEIVEAAFDRYSADVGGMWARIAAYGDVVEGMLAMLEEAFAWFDDPAALHGMRQGVLMHAEALFDDGIASRSAALHRGFLEQATKLVRLAQAQGRIEPSQDPEAVARLFFAVYDGIRLQKLTEPALDTGPYLALLRSLLSGGRLTVPPG